MYHFLKEFKIFFMTGISFHLISNLSTNDFEAMPLFILILCSIEAATDSAKRHSNIYQPISQFLEFALLPSKFKFLIYVYQLFNV